MWLKCQEVEGHVGMHSTRIISSHMVVVRGRTRTQMARIIEHVVKKVAEALKEREWVDVVKQSASMRAASAVRPATSA